MSIIEGARSVAVGSEGMGEEKIAIAVYDFAVDGGAVGAITLRGDSVPALAVVLDSLLLIDTVLTSGGAATVAVAVESAGDIAAAAAITGSPWSTATPKRGTMTSTSTPIKATVKRSLVATVATAALTAGKFRVLVTYVEAP